MQGGKAEDKEKTHLWGGVEKLSCLEAMCGVEKRKSKMEQSSLLPSP